MDSRPLGGESPGTSLGGVSMGAPRRWLAHEARTLGARLALTVKRPRVRASLGDQRDDDGDKDYADELAAVLDGRMRPQHAAAGIAHSQRYPQSPVNLAVNTEK